MADSAIQKKQLLSPEATLEVLEVLKEHAIVFGSGKDEIHTFIDPYCELSQRYISFMFKKKDRMFKKYKLYFYLLELKGKDSSQMISTILLSDNKEDLLKSVMVNHDGVEEDGEADASEIIDVISDAAKKIGVFKRPYIIINGKVK
ncbi:hypothetical protein [Sulfurimonas sp.]|uniref:hypothetical protein n=1 Tax=Sulfurimonas sp. TaxID=2022749 RepID=UPI003569B229